MKKRVWFNGRTTDFQSVCGSSILPTRTKTKKQQTYYICCFFVFVRAEQVISITCVVNRKPECNFYSDKNYEAGSRVFVSDDKQITCDRFTRKSLLELRINNCTHGHPACF